MRAIFLDRDGTINKQVGDLVDVKQLRILPGTASAIKKLNRLGFLVVVITNQPVIARGWLTEKEVDAIHGVLIKRLGKKGAKLDAIYYCPHHPDAQVKKYRVFCRCRKPEIGLILRAAKKFGINLKKSFIVGDTVRWDVLAGKKAKMKTILVKTGVAHDPKYNAKPDFVAKNLKEAVLIIQKHAK